MAPLLLADPIALSCDASGVLRVGVSRVTLDTLVHHYRDGASAEEIALRFESLELPDIHAAIAYYLNHRAELDEYLAERAERAAELRGKIETRLSMTAVRERLRQRGSTGGA